MYKAPKTRIIENVYSDGSAEYVPQYQVLMFFGLVPYWENMDYEHELNGFSYSSRSRAEIRIDEYLKNHRARYYETNVIARNIIDYRQREE